VVEASMKPDWEPPMQLPMFLVMVFGLVLLEMVFELELLVTGFEFVSLAIACRSQLLLHRTQ
jgi:hypothetical protein